MAKPSRDFNIGSTSSVLDEMLGITGTAATAAEDAEVEDQPAVKSETPPIHQPDTGKDRPYTGKSKPSKAARARKTTAPKAPAGGNASRPDPDGMRRWSLYTTEASAAAFDDAVAKIREDLGGDVPKQVVISALLEYAAAGSEQVADVLIELQAHELEERLANLRSR